MFRSVEVKTEFSTLAVSTLAPPGPSSYLNAPSGVSAYSAASSAKSITSLPKLSKQQQYARSLKTLGVVMAVFLAMWVPFCIMWPIYSFCDTCINAELYEFVYWCTYVNSTINPMLYFLSNKDFRTAFVKLVRG